MSRSRFELQKFQKKWRPEPTIINGEKPKIQKSKKIKHLIWIQTNYWLMKVVKQTQHQSGYYFIFRLVVWLT